ncbi:hypothetical protein UMM65_08320 [Aureibaculum sp. 2210JD6-5]|uniref:hypothetical protein n=1 Tax=Aureibaculum sp. 2210JD6-5 TaxID=3103957 RepID=UPI002AADC4B4|nr:hypothetical protein [Aureibaculum sp. 2210JD6-5]MDY7395245.1 hypothetical protein [Aureibaculum sp. 2210JD6-5]
MKKEKVVKIISLISYSLIILMGDMIGLPFLFWLIWTSFEFGNNDQIFAVFGLIGFIMVFTKLYRQRILKVLIFLLMFVPIARRLTEVPFEKFNYLAFQIPLLIFITTSLILIFKPKKEEKTEYNTV